MSRINKPGDILSPGNTSLETSEEPGGGDFLSRVNLTISNFKELLKLAQQFRGAVETGEAREEQSQGKTGPSSPGLADYVQLAIKAGYGDTPLGKMIEQVSPYTLNQIVEIIKRAGPKR